MATNNAVDNSLSGQTGTGSFVGSISPVLTNPALGTPTAIVLTNGTGLPITTGITGLAANIATFLTTPSSANLAAALTDETGTGANVFANTPTLITPLLGTPTSGVLINCTGLPVSTGISGLASNVATFLGTPTSANLASAITDETGTGSLVFSTSPTLVTPVLGTPTSVTLTNATGLPISTGVSGLAANMATFLATPTSSNLAAAMTDETGTGANVFANTPTLITPILGAATATSLTFTSTSGIIGTTTNNNAAAGSVGEIIESTVLVGSAVSLTTATTANITSISLTAGDWSVYGNIWTNPTGTTSTASIQGAITTTSATLPTAPNSGAFTKFADGFTLGQSQGIYVGQTRISIASTTTVYLVIQVSFGISTMGGYGYIGARRMR